MSASLLSRIGLEAETTNHRAEEEILLSSSSVRITLPFSPQLFYRHGWQSWALAAWLPPETSPVPISAPEFRTKDEDPLYALKEKHVSAWVIAVESPSGEVLLLGALGLGGRIELQENTLHGFYEEGSGDWFLATGEEEQVFARYAEHLAKRLGRRRIERAPRVWCSWYSLYRLINEQIILDVLKRLDDLPFDVFQLDDGWQISTGDWEANEKFPSGMAALAEKIRSHGRVAGLWLSPLIVTPDSSIYRNHPDWLLRGEDGQPVFAGVNWSGKTYALDVTHPAVLEWLEALIRKVRSWGYEYLKLDFLYAGALPGKHARPMPREQAYRQALETMRHAAGDAYLLTCGAPVIPSLGLCDGMRVGPDVTPYWLNHPMSVWLNNPNAPSTQNAIRTSLNRLWLSSVVHTDPDVIYFRSKTCWMSEEQKTLLRDLGWITGFKATSDLPHWLTSQDRQRLRQFLETTPVIKRRERHVFEIDGRQVDFRSVMPLPRPHRVPSRLATLAGLVPMVVNEILPAWWISRK
ncbi:MAG: alpha-galactosidase [Anaerolineales bacterium]|nr:alpha-galactosidase [Anaerolineales bacterium]MCX7608464.1 alpha-galactosidase [Anaerolineales bacterium]MDW8226383.1 alpha-galactosidase [Anaerolineales bacterium]